MAGIERIEFTRPTPYVFVHGYVHDVPFPVLSPRLPLFIKIPDSSLVPTGPVLDEGDYWIKKEMKLSGTVCTATELLDDKFKFLPDFLDFTGIHWYELIMWEYAEISSLRHSNIVKCFGVFTMPTNKLPVLINERMEISLHDLLEKTKCQEIPFENILFDISEGLLYLHTHSPTFVHAQLTTRNVLLDNTYKAKIVMTCRCVPRPVTEKVNMYFPPEARIVLDSRYNFMDMRTLWPPTDIFSFGHLALLTITQDLEPKLKDKHEGTASTMSDGRTEIDRRESSFSLLYSKLGKHHHLVCLVEECLQDKPADRPSAFKLVETIERSSMLTKEPSKHKLTSEHQHFEPELASEIQQLHDDKHALQAEIKALRKELKESKKKLNKIRKQKAKEINKKHGLHLLKDYNDVVAVASGFKEKGGMVQEDAEACLLVWVKKKLPKWKLQQDQILPEKIDGVQVVVLEGGEAKFTMDKSSNNQSGRGAERDSDNTRSVRTLQLMGGDRLKPCSKTSHGTLGYFAKDSDGNIGIISAGHVMSFNNEKRLMVPSGNSDPRRPEDPIATVIKISSNNDNVDCGFALLDKDVHIPEYKLKNNETVQSVATSDDDFESEHVFFYGSASREATAIIKATDLKCAIPHPDTRQNIIFEDQLQLSQESQSGDSGALVVEKEDKKAAGLLFGTFEGHGVASPINKVENFLNVNLVTSATD